MKITVKLYASLQKYYPRGEVILELSPGATVAQCAQQLGIPDKEAYLPFVNGIYASKEHLLQDGDRLALFPPIAGGMPDVLKERADKWQIHGKCFGNGRGGQGRASSAAFRNISPKR